MGRLYIPRLGDQLRLTEPWTFRLYDECRNMWLWEYLGLKTPRYRNDDTFESVMLPAGAVLQVDRIFIRKGAAEYDSITFFLVGEKTKKSTKERRFYQVGTGETGVYTVAVPPRAVRFWVKLDDANDIEFESVT